VLRTSAWQRQWYDFFRVPHGVLAATDRRLMYIGVRPEELLRRWNALPSDRITAGRRLVVKQER
jgi:hypothetical protein